MADKVYAGLCAGYYRFRHAAPTGSNALPLCYNHGAPTELTDGPCISSCSKPASIFARPCVLCGHSLRVHSWLKHNLNSLKFSVTINATANAKEPRCQV